MAFSTVTSIPALIAGFPNHPNIIRGLPTFETLHALRQDLQFNAASVPTTLGGGAHGYLGLILDANAYDAVVGNDAAGNPQPFIAPIFPGEIAIVNGANQAARAAQVRQFNYDNYVWHEYYNVQQALRNLLIKAVDDVYLSPLKNKVIGYTNVSVNTMLSHLFNEYGEIGRDELQLNEKRFHEPWDGNEPFEIIICRLDKCVHYASAAKNPYSAEQILSKAELLVLETGLFNKDIQEWNQLPVAARTYGQFKTRILTAQRRRKRLGTANQPVTGWPSSK
jgi:hypothetical protein